MTLDLLTINNNLSKSHSPSPLTAGPKRNAENIVCSPLYAIDRRDSMFSAFCMGLAGSGLGLYDFDRVLFRVSKSSVKK